MNRVIHDVIEWMTLGDAAMPSSQSVFQFDANVKPALTRLLASCGEKIVGNRSLTQKIADLVARDRYRFSPHDANLRYFLRSSAETRKLAKMAITSPTRPFQANLTVATRQ